MTAARAVHLCIGQAYAFSVFNAPLTKVIGIAQSAPDDWKLTTLGWIFSLAIVSLGLSAAFAGRWVEKVGPRVAMFAAACRFGGGAMIGAPLSVYLMSSFKSATAVGVAETFVVMGIVYFISMCIGAFAVRLPAANWKPEGWAAPAAPKRLVTSNHVHIDQALKTPQFWLMWLVLCLNVTAGIGVIGQASVMIQESFSGRVSAAAAAGFVGLMSLFNMGGRFVWASASDYLGRKTTYYLFFALGNFLYAVVPGTGHVGSVALFMLCDLIIISMYGGGFATIPAYIADVFGTKFVGGIHGRILTAWSAAGVFGPVLVNYIRQWLQASR
jgi:MFS family permease